MSTSARLTCLAVAPGPAVLHEMAIAQAKADKTTEATKKKSVLQRVRNKADKAEQAKTEGHAHVHVKVSSSASL